MNEFEDFLVEIGCEELPPKALNKLSQAFADGIEKGLQDAELGFDSIDVFNSPRRLAVRVNQLQLQQKDKTIERRGPATKAPEKAVQGFAKSCGVAIDELDKMATDKGEWFVYRGEQKGQHVTHFIHTIVNDSLAALPIAKRMRWGDNTAEFVRPVHWVLLKLDDRGFSSDAVVIGRKYEHNTRGHRFHGEQEIYINKASDYEAVLETQGHVIVRPEKRRDKIREQVEAAGRQLGGRALIDEDLLDEVTALVEWPSPITGSFSQHFLDVPREVIISTIQDHQKYFPVEDHDGNLLPNFITIANIDSTDPTAVKYGNERVVRPRLDDALFFWKQDQKQKLAERREALKKVVFQKQLGSAFDKTERVAALAEHIAGLIGADATQARRAGELSRCDLLTHLVGEFPDLQGTMGRYYAEIDDESEAVSIALQEQYQPRFAGDALPQTGVGQALALAERLDTLAGIFAIGKKPTGDKDPFGLRRAALGVLRMLDNFDIDIDLAELVNIAVTAQAVKKDTAELVNDVLQFTTDRLRAYWAEQGERLDAIDAVLVVQNTNPRDARRRLDAVNAFLQRPEADSLAAANKRIRNILKKADINTGAVNPDLLTEPAEQALHNAVTAVSQQAQQLAAAKDYAGVLAMLAGLRDAVDAFFDNVMVMADDPAVKANRLSLLNELAALFLLVADFSRLQ